jgi:hypothetical protein
MLPFFEQKELFDRVLRLGKGEQLDPYGVIERFFGDYRLHECRQYLWTMVETCLTTDNAEFSDPEERADLLLRYRDLEGFLEAGYLLLQRHSDTGRNVPGGGRVADPGGQKAAMDLPVGKEEGMDPGGRRKQGADRLVRRKQGTDPPAGKKK